MTIQRLLEIEKRKSEINASLATLKGEELKTACDEVDTLITEEKELRTKATTAAKLNSGEQRGNIVEKPIETPVVEIEKRSKEELSDSAEFRSAFLKNLQGKDLTEIEKRAMVTSSNVGSVIPTQTLNKIVEKLKQVAVIFPMVTSLSIPSNVTIPVEDTVTDASWVAEATASTDGADVTTGSVALGAYKLIKTLEISAAVEAMSIDTFEDFIVNQLGNKVKIAIDLAILKGNGTTQAKGIVNSITAITTAATTGWTYDDVLALLSGLSTMYASNAVILMNRKTLYGQIAKIKDDVKRPIFVASAEDGFAGKIMGYPVKTYDAMDDNQIIFGDFSYYYFNTVKPFAIEKDASVGFRSGSTVYRAMALCDGKVALADAFVVQNLKTGS